MKAAIYKGIGLISVEEADKPVIKEDEYLVKVLYSGICGTDVKTYKQGHRLFSPPCILGHEFSGVIVEVGGKLDKGMLNKKITCAPYVSCYSCNECDNGFHELCNNRKEISSGTFAEYITISSEVAKEGMVVLDDNCDMKELSLTEPVACILNSIARMNFKPGQNALIMGAGPMGLIHIEILRKFGANKVFVSEYNKDRMQIAEKLGAIPINPEVQDIKEVIEKETNGRGVENIAVAIGVPAAVEEAFKYAACGTTINIFGGLAGGSKITLDPNIIHYQEVKLVGSFGFSPNGFRMAAKLLLSGRISLAGIITNVMSIDEIETAFKMSLNQEAVKIVIEL